MEFSLSELCYITANKRKESRHKELEAHLCLRKQNIWTRRVPTLKSEEAESDCLKQRWVVLSDLKLWVNGCVYISDNIRVSPSATLKWNSEHVLSLNMSQKRFSLNSDCLSVAEEVCLVSQTFSHQSELKRGSVTHCETHCVWGKGP